MKILDKDNLIKLYINDCLSKETICKELHVTLETLNYNIQLYNLTRDTHVVKSRSQSKRFKNEFDSYTKHIDIEDLEKFYLIDNHTYEECLDRYQISSWTFDKFLKEHHIRKPKSQSASIGLAQKYKKAGGKDSYNKQLKEKLYATHVKNYGTYENYKSCVSESVKKSWSSTDLKLRQAEWLRDNYFNDPDKINHAKGVRKTTTQSRYGVDNTFALVDYTKYTNTSKVNIRVKELLTEAGIEFETEYRLNKPDGGYYRFDFKCGNTLVEINPWPFHNSTYSIVGSAPLSKSYHFDKTHLAINNGYRVINVWDWDNLDLIIKLLKPRGKCYGRECFVKEISRKDAVEFINSYHLQGYSNDKIRLGLFYNDTLVSVMTFGKPRYNSSCEYELIRYCSSMSVIGGAEKLFKHFINNYRAKSVVSYCDTSKFTGDVYVRLGFRKVSESVSKHWYNIRTGQHILDSSLRARGFDSLLGKVYGYYGKGSSNNDLMRINNFVEIYDAGQSTYKYSEE